jgi:hypothetical protein
MQPGLSKFPRAPLSATRCIERLISRTFAVERLEAIRNRQERIGEMEKDRDALLESYASLAPEALEELAHEERHQVYRMLRLRVGVRIGGALEVNGMFGEEDVFCRSKVRFSTL